ncbi:MAG: primosomal protein N', partial [Coleofasciculaceae cyanobacterium]
QTYSPQHPVIQAVQSYDYQSFTQAELAQREVLSYPPYGKLILLKMTSLDAVEVENTAEIIADKLADTDLNYEILGPAPASIMRVARRYRWQILLKFPLDVPVELPYLAELRSLCPSGVSFSIDVDPLNLG